MCRCRVSEEELAHDRATSLTEQDLREISTYMLPAHEDLMRDEHYFADIIAKNIDFLHQMWADTPNVKGRDVEKMPNNELLYLARVWVGVISTLESSVRDEDINKLAQELWGEDR